MARKMTPQRQWRHQDHHSQDQHLNSTTRHLLDT